MSKKLSVAVTLVLSIIIGASAARAAEIKLFTTGAFKPEVLALVPDFEKQTGHKVTVDNGTAGELKKRIEGREVFDVAVITPDVVDDLIAKGKIAAGSRARQRRRKLLDFIDEMPRSVGSAFRKPNARTTSSRASV